MPDKDYMAIRTPEGLNLVELLFIERYMICGNVARVGRELCLDQISPKEAENIFRTQRVQDAIAKRKKAVKSVMNARDVLENNNRFGEEWVAQTCIEVAMDPKTRPNDKVKAVETVAKMLGSFKAESSVQNGNITVIFGQGLIEARVDSTPAIDVTPNMNTPLIDLEGGQEGE